MRPRTFVAMVVVELAGLAACGDVSPAGGSGRPGEGGGDPGGFGGSGGADAPGGSGGAVDWTSCEFECGDPLGDWRTDRIESPTLIHGERPAYFEGGACACVDGYAEAGWKELGVAESRHEWITARQVIDSFSFELACIEEALGGGGCGRAAQGCAERDGRCECRRSGSEERSVVRSGGYTIGGCVISFEDDAGGRPERWRFCRVADVLRLDQLEGRRDSLLFRRWR